jgi:hypothetical protein
VIIAAEASGFPALLVILGIIGLVVAGGIAIGGRKDRAKNMAGVSAAAMSLVSASASPNNSTTRDSSRDGHGESPHPVQATSARLTLSASELTSAYCRVARLRTRPTWQSRAGVRPPAGAAPGWLEAAATGT